MAARDVLGRDGALSPGLLATVCDRMPPLPPTDVHVLNNYVYNPSTQLSTQALQLVWQQNLQTNDTVTNYWIYRWTNLVEMNAWSGNPSNNLIAVVPHIPNAANNTFRDDGPGSPTVLGAYGQTFWYTVRAGDDGACGQNLSGTAGPAFGVLRQRVGPGAGAGCVEINCFQPNVSFAGSSLFALANGPDANHYDVLLNCSRGDARFEWAEFYGTATYTGPNGGSPVVVSNFLGRFYYEGTAPVSVGWTPWRTNQQYRVQLRVGCRTALVTGKTSAFTTVNVNPPDFAFYDDVEFRTVALGVHVVAGDTNNPDCQQHDLGGGFGGLAGTNNIIVHFQPTAGSKEFRLYRRVDNGPVSLLCQGAITNVALLMTCFEDAPPVNGGTICFYLQLLDENGNASPMAQLGCVDSAPSTAPPIPILAKITSTGDQNSAGMTLSWFCPPYGVERFEVRIAGLPTQSDTNNLALSASLGSLGASVPMTVTNLGVTTMLPFFTFITPRVGPGFGNNGAEFSVPCSIELGKTYFVTVRALVNKSYPGDFSATESFLWTPTNAVSAQVPWPARGLPGINSNFPLLNASFLSPASSTPAQRTGAYTGNGVLIGVATLGTNVTVDSHTGPAFISALFNPIPALVTNTTGDALLPCVLYRFQVPNTNYPTTSGDVIQVSPLMETVAYATNQTTASTTAAREDHTATLLLNGQVLVAGGRSTSEILSSAELYDPVSGTRRPTGAMTAPRTVHTAALLTNGLVLVVGGAGTNDILSSAELYDPATEIWRATGSLTNRRRFHTETSLPNGQVLVAGGFGGGTLSSAELYDPASGRWTATAPMTTRRQHHTANLADLGAAVPSVFVAGGDGPLSSAELYDPVRGTWRALDDMFDPRTQHTAISILNRKEVLVAGGDGVNGVLSSAEIFFFPSLSWNFEHPGPLITARYDSRAVLLSNGNVLMAGGHHQQPPGCHSARRGVRSRHRVMDGNRVLDCPTQATHAHLAAQWAGAGDRRQ